jgi:hypothetical protein
LPSATKTAGGVHSPETERYIAKKVEHNALAAAAASFVQNCMWRAQICFCCTRLWTNVVIMVPFHWNLLVCWLNTGCVECAALTILCFWKIKLSPNTLKRVEFLMLCFYCNWLEQNNFHFLEYLSIPYARAHYIGFML